MTTLYRTPNLIFGEFEWHAAVKTDGVRVRTQYYFRPLTRALYRWKPVTSWPGTKPPLWRWFHSYRHSVKIVMNSVRVRNALITEQPVGVVRRLTA